MSYNFVVCSIQPPDVCLEKAGIFDNVKKSERKKMAKGKPNWEYMKNIEITHSKTGLFNNTRCLICGTYHTYKGITYHMKHTHNCGQVMGVNFIKIDEAGSTVTSKKPKNDGTAGKQLRPKNAKCLVSGCGHITSDTGIYEHLRKKHDGMKAIKGENWERIEGVESTPKRQYKLKETMSPQGGYITIPIMIRIPIVLGKPEIVQS